MQICNMDGNCEEVCILSFVRVAASADLRVSPIMRLQLRETSASVDFLSAWEEESNHGNSKLPLIVLLDTSL